MKITRLTEDSSSANCHLVQIGEHKILVDCGLDLSTLEKATPNWGYTKKDTIDESKTIGEHFAHDSFNRKGRSEQAGVVANGQETKVKEQFERTSTEWDFKFKQNHLKLGALDNTQKANFFSNLSKKSSTFPALIQPPLLSYLSSTDIDAIIITNPFQMLALPYITEYSDFSGQVIATEPTLQFGRQLMEELVGYFGPCSNITSLPSFSFFNAPSAIPPSSITSPENSNEVLCQFAKTCSWRPLYSHHEALTSLRKIRPVQFKEKTVLHQNLVLEPFCSGYSLGSANWLISFGETKLGYISASSQFRQLHPLSLDNDIFSIATHLLFTDIPRPKKVGATLIKPISPEDNLNRISSEAVRTVKNGGNVLFPCHIQGVIFDLIESISKLLDNLSLSCTIFVISPVAEVALHYSNIAGEWMNTNRQQMMYLPEMPLVHGKLMANNKLIFSTDIHSKAFRERYTSPCIIFASHPSLRAGPALHFLHLWKDKPKNMVVFTDPHYNGSQQLDSLKSSFSFQVQNMFLESRLLQNSVYNLIKKYSPSYAILPNFFVKPDLLGCQSKLIYEKSAHDIELDSCSFPFVKARITPALARSISVKRRGRVELAKISAILQLADHQYVLDASHKRKAHTPNLSDSLVSPQVLVQALTNSGYEKLKIKSSLSGLEDSNDLPVTEILIPALKSSVILTPQSIHICAENTENRIRITRLVQSIKTPGFDFLPLIPFPPPRKEIKLEEMNAPAVNHHPRPHLRPTNRPPPGSISKPADLATRPHAIPRMGHRASIPNDYRPPPAYSNFRPPFRPNFIAVQQNNQEHSTTVSSPQNETLPKHHVPGRHPPSTHYPANYHGSNHKSNFSHRLPNNHREPHPGGYSQRPRQEYRPMEYPGPSRSTSRHSEAHRPYRMHRPRPDDR